MTRGAEDIDLTSDRALLEGYRRGEPWVLEKLYRAHVGRVARLVAAGFHFKRGETTHQFTGVPTRYDLEVVVQDVFSRVFSEKSRQSYDGLRPFEGYLVGIARYACIDWLRARESRQRKAAAERESVEMVASTQPFEDLDGRELSRLLGAFVERLSVAERTIMEKRLRDREPQEAIAKQLEMSRIQLRRMEAKLKRDLFRYLSDHGYLSGVKPPSSSLIRAEDD